MTPQERIQEWLDGPYDPAVKAEIRRLQAEKPDRLVDAFYRDLSFGTGGMRGIMGIGTNRMNIYTVRAATQGLACYLLKQELGGRVFIGYDVRENSQLFAEETARVLAGNDIEAYVTKEICPTPLASFGCRHFGCRAAIMITASHNPPEYNGYKVYWSDGAQIVFPHDVGIIEEVRKIRSPDQVKLAPRTDIHWVGSEIDQSYFEHLIQLRLYPEPSPLKIIYTNLHGTGIRLLPEALKRWGFSDVRLVEAERPLDPHFSAVPSPNPEEEKALHLGTEQLMQEHADILLATDPDADRLGAVVRDKQKAFRLTGNQIACLSLQHIGGALSIRGEIPPNAAFIKTIVTTELFRKIAEDLGGKCFDVLTGFKYIAELIREWEESFGGYQFIFGAEESHGFLFGTFVRDKDGISAGCVLAEAASRAHKQNITLVDRLYELYRKYGVHRELLATLSFFDSPSGLQQMQQLMQRLRDKPLTRIGKRKIIQLDDYLKRLSTETTSGKTTPLLLPSSDVLRYNLDDRSKLVIRPSGTEPKIKIYIEVVEKPTRLIDEAIVHAEKKLHELLADFKSLDI